ncbi:MAG: AAA family ATPase [Anaerolineae bacterium]|nr:AAA family ATPase [Anaerolineae bacterium]MDW8172311.1 AAA family ATPase [Anaerolineae bacterium]
MTAQPKGRTLALVGMPGAGKTLCAKHLEQRNFFQFRFGSIVTDEVLRRGLPLTPEHERIVREEFRARDGMDAIAKRALPLLQAALQQHDCIVIDGLYSQSEYRTLREALGDTIILVAIVAERRLRYERLAQRSERPLTFEEAEERDMREIEHIEKGGPIALADYTLLNNGEPEALLARLDALLERLNFRPQPPCNPSQEPRTEV